MGSVQAAASGGVRELGSLLSASDLADAYRAAGAPEAWVDSLVAISLCESGHGGGFANPHAVGDQGASLGHAQLWRGWFAAAGEDVAAYADPIVNARVAVHVRAVRGRFGGGGGWTCADILGIW